MHSKQMISHSPFSSKFKIIVKCFKEAPPKDRIFKMLFYVNIFLITVLNISCEAKTSVLYTVIQGEICTDTREVQINYKNEWKDLSLTKNGTFCDTLTINKPQYIYLSAGENSTRIYVTPGSKISISIDSTFSFSGTDAGINSYLYEAYLDDQEREEKEFNNHERVFTKKEVDYVKYRDAIKTAKLNKLTKLPAGTEEFQNFHKKDIEYQYQYDVARYPNYHSYYFNNYKPTSIITNFYKDVDLDNETYAQHYSGYRSLVDLILDKHVERLEDSIPNPLDAHLTVLENIQSPTILNDRLIKTLYYFTVNEKNMEDVWNRMLSLAKLNKTKEAITQHYEVISQLKPGTLAPNFDFENYSGSKTKLTDLKGKYVYIDIWATWCAPCIKEIPYLKKLEEEFSNSKIEFVSVSVDDQRFYDTWREMVKNKELGGIQLIADSGWNSDIIGNYGIQGLPHFILIDDKGKIVSAKAEQPSNPNLKAKLRTFLND